MTQKKFPVSTDNRLNPELKKEIRNLRGLMFSNVPKIKNPRFEMATMSDRPAVVFLDTETMQMSEPIGLCDLHGAVKMLNFLYPAE